MGEQQLSHWVNYRTAESCWGDLVADALDSLDAEDARGVQWATDELQRLRAALSRAEAEDVKLRAENDGLLHRLDDELKSAGNWQACAQQSATERDRAITGGLAFKTEAEKLRGLLRRMQSDAILGTALGAEIDAALGGHDAK